MNDHAENWGSGGVLAIALMPYEDDLRQPASPLLARTAGRLHCELRSAQGRFLLVSMD